MNLTFHDLFNIGFSLTLGFYAAKLTATMVILAVNLLLASGRNSEGEGEDNNIE